MYFGLLCLLLIQAANSVVAESKHPIVIVLGFDGFRYDWLHKGHTPTLQALMANGISVPYADPVFPTMSMVNFQTIATGLLPESHGVTQNVVYDRLHKRYYDGYQDEVGLYNYRKDVLPLWFRNEMAGDGRYSGVYMWPGSNHGYGKNSDAFPTYYIAHPNDSIPYEKRVDTIISWITDKEKPANCLFLFTDKPDLEAHAYGPDSSETMLEVEKVDGYIAYLIKSLKKAKVYDKTNLIIASDHGMTNCTPRQIINITSLIDFRLVEAKFIHTPTTQLLAKEGKFEELYRSLLNQSRNYPMTVYKRGEIENYSASHRILDIIIIADQGYSFDDFYETIEWYNTNWNLTDNPDWVYGSHGYSHELMDMKAIFVAHGPAFKKGQKHEVISLMDIVPLVAKIIGIPEPPNNGSLDKVIGMLRPSFSAKDNGKSSSANPRPLFVIFSLIVFKGILCLV